MPKKRLDESGEFLYANTKRDLDESGKWISTLHGKPLTEKQERALNDARIQHCVADTKQFNDALHVVGGMLYDRFSNNQSKMEYWPLSKVISALFSFWPDPPIIPDPQEFQREKQTALSETELWAKAACVSKRLQPEEIAGVLCVRPLDFLHYAANSEFIYGLTVAFQETIKAADKKYCESSPDLKPIGRTPADGAAHARDGKTRKNAPRNEKIVSEFRKLMARKVPPSRTEAARRIGEKQTPPLGEDQVRRILGKVWDSAKPQK